ncbi:DUF2339 domain-containing protein [Rhodococcus erythropolis]|uniref:DUF2339 domain-containing protein n=1 Tax=Rhodococcus erythropolis TaxID=1833 RepID=UPI0012928492|nr:DUF2339 domain-containing protein [Rhodococcus erythropolis]MQP35782.1 DUF2339 domain-containing protein [Rhodococcus erythropolis]
MTTPSSPAVDPRLVTALSAECDSIGRQLRHMGQNLSILQTQLASATVPPPMPVVPAPAAPAPQMPPMRPQQNVPTWQPPMYPVAAPRQPWWQRDGVISRLLAAAGVAVTLIGVVMLLVLAAQAGFFGPPLRVLGGALLSGALVFAGVRVHGRPGGKVGAIALAATGFAGMYLDVVAASVLYGWVTTPLAVVIAFGIAAAGVALGVKWDSESLALMIVLGAAVLAPVLTSGISLTLIGFLFAIQSATFSAQLGRDWKYLGMARTVPVVLALLVAIASESIFSESGNSAVQLVISAGVVAIVGAGCAMAMQWTGSPSRGGVAGAWSTATFVVSSLPLMSVGAVLGRTESAVLYGIAALLLLSAAAAAKPLPTQLRFGLGATGALALLLCCLSGATESLVVPLVLTVGMIFLGVSLYAGSRFVFALGTAFAAIGSIGYLTTVPPEALTTARAASMQLGAITALSSLTAIGALVMLVWAIHRLKLIADSNAAVLWAAAGFGVLYAVTCALVSSGVEIFDSATGFVAGHSVATIVWMLAATSALVLGLNNRQHARVLLGAGLALTSAAVAKLFLFDLATLSGLVRSAAFLVVGLLLLLVGTRYARAFAKQEQVSSASGS